MDHRRILKILKYTYPVIVVVVGLVLSERLGGAGMDGRLRAVLSVAAVILLIVVGRRIYQKPRG